MGFGGHSHSCAVGDRVITGRINRHTVIIKARPHEVYHILIDIREMQRCCPQDKLSVEKVSPGRLSVGTKMRYHLNYRINPTWESVVVDMEENSRIINQFVDGFFKGSFEIWQLKKLKTGTELSHMLIYRIKRFIFRIGWMFFRGEAKHNELTTLALDNIKRFVEEKTQKSMGPK